MGRVLVPPPGSRMQRSQPPQPIAHPQHEATIRAAMEALDFEHLARRYREQGEFLFIERFLDGPLLDQMVREVEAAARDAFRVNLPFVKKAGALGQEEVARKAPTTYALYRS